MTDGYSDRTRPLDLDRLLAIAEQHASEPVSDAPILGRCDLHGEWVIAEGISSPTLASVCPACARAKRVQAGYERAGIPRRYQHKTLDTYATETAEQSHALAVCQAYVADIDATLEAAEKLLLVGTVGTGKTHLACAVADAFLAAGHSARYLRTFELFQRFQDARRWQSEVTPLKLVTELTDVDLLVIDEIGVEGRTDEEQGFLLEVLSRRYEAVKPTVIGSNLDIDELRALFGVRGFDRLRGNARVATCDWESWRGRAEDAALTPQESSRLFSANDVNNGSNHAN